MASPIRYRRAPIAYRSDGRAPSRSRRPAGFARTRKPAVKVAADARAGSSRRVNGIGGFPESFGECSPVAHATGQNLCDEPVNSALFVTAVTDFHGTTLY